MIKIAAILTCFNRQDKTLSCLQHLFSARNYFNNDKSSKIKLTVYLTDDGCTDGTANAVLSKFNEEDIVIIKGDGSLYWAGGMRMAWQKALISNNDWDFFLLINDDTYVQDDVFCELIDTDTYAHEKYEKSGIYSGITYSTKDNNKITYGGERFLTKYKSKKELVKPIGVPQKVDMTHANVLMVSKNVVDKIGIFYEGYKHSCADNDYSLCANEEGFPVLVTAHSCAICENDHKEGKEEINLLCSMSFKEKSNYFRSPLHSDHDYLLLIRRHMPIKLPFTWILRKIRILMPGIYYTITKLRGIQ